MEFLKTTFGFVIKNWSAVMGLICMVAFLGLSIRQFFKLTLEAQKKKVKQCLLSWVMAAEKDLGSKTGKIKLSLVYSMFVEAFPVFQMFVSIDTFGGWVDEALLLMKDVLNNGIKQIDTKGGESDE